MIIRVEKNIIPLQVAHSFLFWVAHLIRCYHVGFNLGSGFAARYAG